jgi:Lon protease-like protein
MVEMPMFPLGMVLFPTMILPLRVFEPRYQALVLHCMENEPEFGVCLIERGSEVGGGDQRSSIGTVAQIVDARQFPDGRWALATVGTRRIVIERWLEDDPYPRAAVTDWLDAPFDQDLSSRRDRVVNRMRRALALQTELGEPAAPATVDIDSDPTIAGYQVAALAPVGAFDRYQLLAAPSVPERYDLLDDHLDGAIEVFTHRLSMG